MKKKIFGAVVVVVIAVGAMTNVNLNHSNKYSALTLKSIESLASPEGQVCVSDPSKNWGVCKANTYNGVFACVTAGFWDDKDCVAVY